MSTGEIISSGLIAAVIFFYIKHKQYRDKVERIKKTFSIRKAIDSLSYFKGEKFSYKDVREYEIKRVMKELQQYSNFNDINTGHIKAALYEVISEMNSIKSNVTVVEESININQIDQMDGIKFEYFLKQFFEKRGYKVKLTPSSGDQGVDLILLLDNRKIAIQAKRYSQTNKVGNSAVQQVSTGKLFYGCDEAYVITSSYFTGQAIELAKKAGVKLIDRDGLQSLLKGRDKL